MPDQAPNESAVTLPASDTARTIAPASMQECADQLRACTKQSQSVMPIGGGTKLRWGNPVKAPVTLDTKNLNGVREHSWQDMTATVGAGTPWSAMQQALAQHGQMVALDPLWPDRATVGGIIATNDSGSLRLKYGSLRDLIIGMTVVLADGTIARSGGKVVKNVAGYDLHKLMIGAFGTLGLITEVTFRLHPIEKHIQSWTARTPSPAAAGAAMLAILDSTTSPTSLQMRSEANATYIDIRLDGISATASKLQQVTPSLEWTSASAEVWQIRQQLFSDPEAFILKITALPAKLAAILDGFARTSPSSRCIADAVGICTVALHGDVPQITSLIEDLRARIESTGGAVVLLQTPHSIAAENASQNIDRWGGLPPAIAVMREVKRQFDPTRILNPGRFVGGI